MTKFRDETNLFAEKLGEETLSLDGGDVTSVIAPYEHPALDVQQEQPRRRARHSLSFFLFLSLGWRWLRSRSSFVYLSTFVIFSPENL